MADGLSIREVAEQTGLAPGTIRMWEQRHGFPSPRRTASGYRRYEPDDVETLRRARAHRQRGLSVSAALERARETGGGLRPSVDLRRRGGAPTTARARRSCASRRWSRCRGPSSTSCSRAPPRRCSSAPSSASASIARWSRATAGWRATPTPRRCSPTSPRCAGPRARRSRCRSPRATALANEWAVIVDAPGYAACLLAWEQPGAIAPDEPDDGDRRFEAIWTIDPRATRRAAQAAARLAGNADAGVRAPARGAPGRPPAGHGAAGAGAHRADQPPAGLRRGRARH